VQHTSYEAPHYAVFSSLLPLFPSYSLQHPLLRLNQYSSLSAGDQVLHPYKITRRIMVLYVLILKFLENRREDRRVLNGW